MLKDFRKILSLKEELSFKDFKDQAYYKISKILHIILLYGYPQNLVLIGDSIESDLLIYSIIKKILSFDSDHKILFDEIFSTIKLTTKQKTDLSEKILELSQWREIPKLKIEIFIRDPQGAKATLSVHSYLPRKTALKVRKRIFVSSRSDQFSI